MQFKSLTRAICSRYRRSCTFPPPHLLSHNLSGVSVSFYRDLFLASLILAAALVTPTSVMSPRRLWNEFLFQKYHPTFCSDNKHVQAVAASSHLGISPVSLFGLCICGRSLQSSRVQVVSPQFSCCRQNERN